MLSGIEIRSGSLKETVSIERVVRFRNPFTSIVGNRSPIGELKNNNNNNNIRDTDMTQ